MVRLEPRRLDVFLSHDWPQGMRSTATAQFGAKSHTSGEIGDGSLGSPPMAHLLHTLKPRYFSRARQVCCSCEPLRRYCYSLPSKAETERQGEECELW